MACLVLVLLGSAVLLQPVARATSPAFAVHLASGFGNDRELVRWSMDAHHELFREHCAAFDQDAEYQGGVRESGPGLLDPWGQPWRLRALASRVQRAGKARMSHFVLAAHEQPYSVGPDGLDQHGEGDDLEARSPEWSYLLPSEVRTGWRVTLVLLAMLLALELLVTVTFVPARRRSKRVEAARAAALVGPWVLLAALWVSSVHGNWVGRRVSQQAEGLGVLVPAPVAALGTVAAALFGLALAWRLSRPLAEPTSPGA